MHVILGTGPVGISIMKELLALGKRVQMVNTSGVKVGLPQAVEIVKANLYNVEDAKDAMKGAEVVYQCSQPPYHKWDSLFMKLQDSIVEAAAFHKAKLVVTDNLYMYGEVNGIIHEGLPNKATTKKGKIRAQLAEKLLDLHKQGILQVVIGRGSDFFGPHVIDSKIGERLFKPIIRGGSCTIIGNPNMPHTYTFIEDFGKALVTLGQHEDVFGEVWHVPNAPTVTTKQFVEMIYAAVGHTPKIRGMGKTMLRIGGIFLPAARETIEILYQVEKPFIVDSSKFTKRFNQEATPLEVAIQKTVDWYTTH